MDEKIYQNIDTPKINPLEPIDNNLSQLVTIKILNLFHLSL